MEYIYIDEGTEGFVDLQKMKGLRYSYIDNLLEIIDDRGEQKACFHVKRHTCYMLQRRNKSALQLHEVTPPHFCVDMAVWLFGFGRKQHCENMDSFTQACANFQKAYPDSQIIVRDVDCRGSYLKYAFTMGNGSTSKQPVAYCYKLTKDTAWAFTSKEVLYTFIAKMHEALGEFRYPLQYVIHMFKVITPSTPVEAKEFFQKTLWYQNKDVHYTNEFSVGGF